MKKTICLLLVFSLLFSLALPAFASSPEEPGEAEYYTVPVEYSDNVGQREDLELMVQDSHVYVNAEMLGERFGFRVNASENGVSFTNNGKDNDLPDHITVFYYNSTKVVHRLFTEILDTYEAPFPSLQNSEGSWIPFEYALLLMNSGLMITDNALSIDMPDKRIVDRFFDIMRDGSYYRFDLAEDLGYSEKDMKVLGNSSHLINVFNGMLTTDTDAWAVFFQRIGGSTAAYDAKYGEELTLLLCTEADKELQQAAEAAMLAADLLGKDGAVGSMLKLYDKKLDITLGELLEECGQALESVKSGNSPLIAYNRSYQKLEAVFDKQSEVYAAMDSAERIQNGAKAVGILLQIFEFVEEFWNQDAFSCAALLAYLNSRTDEANLPDAMERSMRDRAASLSGSISGYAMDRIQEHMPEWIMEFAPMELVIGPKADALLLAWRLASNLIPFFSQGIAGADMFELTLYAQLFQCDAYLNFVEKRSAVFGGEGEITAEKLYEAAQYAYVYLKSCYTAREAAIAFLTGDTGAAEGSLQSAVEGLNEINLELAEQLVGLKKATPTNESGVYGFLPADNRTYLEQYDDSWLIDWLRLRCLVTDAFSDEFNGRSFHIPRINLSKGDVPGINEALWNDYYHGVAEKELEHRDQSAGEYRITVSYDWYVNQGVLSLVVEYSIPEMSDYKEYQVYNLSVEDGRRLTNSDLLSMTGFTEEEYAEAVRQVLGSKFVEYFPPDPDMISMFGSDYWERGEKTISDENVRRCMPYLNEEGQLCIVGFFYCMIGPDGYWYEFNLEDYELNPDYQEFLRARDSAASTSPFAERYQEVLMDCPVQTSSYALYDIDKDGTPELIIRQGAPNPYAEYRIYTIVGDDLLYSDAMEWYYDDALYGADGNTLIVRYGGQGMMRIESADRYKMVDGYPVYVEELMSTEGDSIEEIEEAREALEAFLSTLTPIPVENSVLDYAPLYNYAP